MILYAKIQIRDWASFYEKVGFLNENLILATVCNKIMFIPDEDRLGPSLLEPAW